MRVVLYMRYSSDRQTEQSIEGQNRVCTAFCEQQGYEIVDRYIDRATSAFKDTDKRTEFQRMIRDSEKQLWEGIVVYKLDRFARNRYDSATYKARLKKNGVRVISATENISDNPEGVILEAVLEGMAEFYSKELSQKITRGMFESANKCHSIGGHIPLGYKIENKKLVIDEAGAAIVREAFDLYANGATVAEICETFNTKGYRTAKNAEFNKNSFRSMFKNERYIGIYKYKDLRIEGGVPAIVDKDIFTIVQKKLSKNAEAPSRGKAKIDYLLSQKLFCGHCGSLMTGESGTGKGGTTYFYYTCGKRKREHTCDKKPLKKDFIERAVVEDALTLLTPETINELADIAVKESVREMEENSIIPALKNQLHETERSINNLVKMVEKGVESDTIADRLKELEKEKRAIEKRLVVAQDDYVILEKDHIVWWLSEFCNGDIEDEEFRRHIIDLLVNSVTVWDEPDGWYKITSVYNLTSNKTKTFRCSDLSGQAPPKQPNRLFRAVFLILRELKIEHQGFFYPVSKFRIRKQLFRLFQTFVCLYSVCGIVPYVGKDKIIAGLFVQLFRKRICACFDYIDFLLVRKLRKNYFVEKRDDAFVAFDDRHGFHVALLRRHISKISEPQSVCEDVPARSFYGGTHGIYLVWRYQHPLNTVFEHGGI